MRSPYNRGRSRGAPLCSPTGTRLASTSWSAAANGSAESPFPGFVLAYISMIFFLAVKCLVPATGLVPADPDPFKVQLKNMILPGQLSPGPGVTMADQTRILRTAP